MTPPAATSPKRPKTLQLVVAVGLGLFLLGWALGRCSSAMPRDEPTSPPRSGSSVPAAQGTQDRAADAGAVQLRLDAGGLRLLPDASLHLKPIVPIEGENLDE